MKKKLYLIIVCFFISYNFIFIFSQTEQQVITFISPRSQSFNLARLMAGWDDQIHTPKDYFYMTHAFTGEISTTFRTERINQCFFGQDSVRKNKNDTEWKDSILVSGSHTHNRLQNRDWLADYFGLPTDFKSVVHFHPRANNYLIDANLFFGLNTITKGLYLLCDIPLLYTNSNIKIKERIIDVGVNNYDPGYYNATGVDRQNLLDFFTQFISGAAIPRIDGLIFHKLANAKMTPYAHRKIGIPELRGTLGYDHFINEIHHIGGNIQLAAPTGNRPRGEFLFEPLCGNGHHWELGVGFSAHACTWYREETDEQTTLFMEAAVTHLFATKQRRSFDLKEKPNSRYMIAQKMNSDITNNLNGNGITPIAQFAGEVTPIANLTTCDISVAINIQADVAFMYVYTKKNTDWSFGYSLWKRSNEEIKIDKDNRFEQNIWAIKGDAYLYGFIPSPVRPAMSSVALAKEEAVAISATENKASINAGTNFPPQGLSNNQEQQMIQIHNARKNNTVDNPQPAFAGTQYLVATGGDMTQANQINTSIQPLFISWSIIDINSAQTSGFSHKIFTHMRHRVRYTDHYEAYIGLGAEIEFGRQAGPMPIIGSNKSINCALSSCGVWLKGNVSF